MRDDLLELLLPLDGVLQNRRYHPEGDALYHSLQAFELARKLTGERLFWAAALLHDVGKAPGEDDHAAVGADLLEGLVAPGVVWLVRHHLDLLYEPALTKRRRRGTAALRDLTLLRRCDVGGRSPTAKVMDVGDALELLFAQGSAFLSPEAQNPYENAGNEED